MTKFITEEIQTLSPKNQIHGVKINQVFTNNIAVAETYHIIIGPDVQEEIIKAQKENDFHTLNKWRGVLQHENQHIQNKDAIISTAACFAIPLTTHWSIKALRGILPIAKKHHLLQRNKAQNL